jgi:transcriptional regulator with XRE-family HTH domain
MAKSQYPIDAKTLGEKIRKNRMDRNWTLLKVAKIVGISESYLARIEADKQIPSVGDFNKISTALDLHPTIYMDFLKIKYPELNIGEIPNNKSKPVTVFAGTSNHIGSLNNTITVTASTPRTLSSPFEELRKKYRGNIAAYIKILKTEIEKMRRHTPPN